jgi:selenobiotic family peptide radical SAM maturase
MQRNLKVKSRTFNRTYPVCRRQISEHTWQQLIARVDGVEFFADNIISMAAELQLPEYLAEIARMELYVYSLETDRLLPAPFADTLTINPTLELFTNSWKNLALQFNDGDGQQTPEKGSEHVIVWLQPLSDRIKIKPVSEEDLLAMKMVLEELSVQEVVGLGDVHTAAVETTLVRALNEGIIIGPEPGIKRHFKPGDYKDIDRSFYAARIFSLQWHITQACDLHCRHCYDRNQYKSLSCEQETAILDDLVEFCSVHKVHGQVTFTGGNPLLHPDFERLYQDAAERGFTTAILGNPTTRKQLERLIGIQPPAFYQVSLEGLQEHNDYMRGQGHFNKVLAFLELLQDLNIFSMVMLTLTRANIDQVLPLVEILNHKTDLFTFNRLSLVGEGANLTAVDISKYPGFLKTYIKAVRSNPCLGIKDNLLNILYHEQGHPLFGGCTGHGCGAAFNFITLLADGAVHACRKFPSPLGNILQNSLHEIYHSETAERYRDGAAECRDCSIRPVCRGCLAVAHSHNLDVFTRKDPYCFINTEYYPT